MFTDLHSSITKNIKRGRSVDKCKYTNRITALLALCIILSTLLIGCGKDNSKTIITINDNKLTDADFRYDIFLVETEGNTLEEYYQSNYGCSYWDFEYNGITMRTAAKNSILTKVVMNEILADLATKDGISLTDQELLDNEAAVDKFISQTDANALEAAGLTKSILVKAYNKIALSDKYYNKLLEQFELDEEAISNSVLPENYIEYKTECIYILNVYEENNSIIHKNQSEITAARDKITLALERIKMGDDFNEVLEKVDGLTFDTRDFILKDQAPEQQYKDAAIKLKNGEYSSAIVSSDYAYYIIHMLDNNSKGRQSDYETALEDARKEQENKLFEEKYSALKGEYNIQLNQKNWDCITLGNAPK